MIDRTNLVVLKADKELFICNELFKPNRNYRCIKATEGKRNEFLVYGIVFDEKTFNETFEYSYDRIMKHFKLGRKFKIWFFRYYGLLNDVPTHILYGFYPEQANKTENLKECYQYYLGILSGNLNSIDEQDVCFGNKGIPLTYNKLGIR